MVSVNSGNTVCWIKCLHSQPVTEVNSDRQSQGFLIFYHGYHQGFLLPSHLFTLIMETLAVMLRVKRSSQKQLMEPNFFSLSSRAQAIDSLFLFSQIISNMCPRSYVVNLLRENSDCIWCTSCQNLHILMLARCWVFVHKNDGTKISRIHSASFCQPLP